MSREVHVRFCESLRGRFPWATRLILLARSREEAERALGDAETCLASLGLRLNHEKTAVRHIRDGVSFLGIAFDGSEVAVASEEWLRLFKEPLYVTEPYLFLGISGDALEIRRHREVIETIPIRRISEIMVLEMAIFSAAVVRKCAENGIPLTLTLNTGYFVATVKPDSRRHYDICHLHARRYESLSDTEILCLAKEFAAGKVTNYAALFRQRCSKGTDLFLGSLARIAEAIRQARSLNEVRDHEKAAAEQIYRRFDDLIEHKAFRLRKRETKKNSDRMLAIIKTPSFPIIMRASI